MAPDQESSGGQVVKPLDDPCESDKVAKSPLKSGALTEPVNGCGTKDPENGPADKIPDKEPCDLVRLDWFQVQRVGAGLANLGNSCFLNTVIQCLTYCPPLANYLLQNDHSSSCQSFEFCMMCELQKHMKEALERSGDVIEPVHIYENLKLIAEHFQSGQQEDAHEFLRFVIENLWRASLYNYNNEHIDPDVRETTVINYIFGGYNRSQVVCLRCNKRSNTYEHFMDFILDIKHSANTLEKALEQYVKPELLDKDNAYNCPQCNTLVPAEKTYSIHRAPNVATIQLKRFDYNKSHGGKITKHVSYPEQLDLRPFMSEKTDVPLLYKLNAVLVHVGQNCNSGHYYCYVRNSNGHWYLMDDAKVQRVGLSDVLNQQAYLLFYVRLPVTNGVAAKKDETYINGVHLKTGRAAGSNGSSDFNLRRKRKLYMPFSKWATCRRNHWNGYRKPNLPNRDRPSYTAAKRGNSHSSSSSSSCDDKSSSHSSRDSNATGKNGPRNNGVPSNGAVDNVRNGFSTSENGHCDSVESHPHHNGVDQQGNHKATNGEVPAVLNNYRISSDAFYSKNRVHKDYNDRRFPSDFGRNGSGNYGRSYERRSYSQMQNTRNGNCYNSQMRSYRGFGRSASDTDLYVDYNRYNRVPNDYSGAKYNWKLACEFRNGLLQERDCWKFRNHRELCHNEAYSYEQPHYDSNQWVSRNGFRSNPKYPHEDKNRHNFDRDRANYRKFNEKSRSVDFSAFSQPRYYPYYNPRRQIHLQECF